METMKIEADTVENAEFYANEIRGRGIKVLCCYSSAAPMIYVYCKTARDKRNVKSIVWGAE